MQIATREMNLSWIVISDMDAAIKFYTEVVGLTLLYRQDEFGWAELGGSGGARLGLGLANPMMDMPAGSNAIVTITVDDIEATAKEFAGKGATLLGEIQEIPGECKMQLIADADGNRFHLHQPLK